MFKDLKILELASVLAGPAVGQFFAELGATVIKVENAKSGGDVTRTWKASGEATDDRSAYFCSVNWGKKSIALNLDNSESRNILLRLAQQSDVVIASYKPGDAAKMGVDYETLRKVNPTLIYGQITGYGADNSRVGYDAVIQAEAGFMFMNGEPGGASLKMPVALVDILAAHHLKEGILLAMLRMAKTGQGDFVEVSLIQAAIASLANQASNWLVGGKIPQKQGSAHPNIAPYGDVLTTAEGREILLAIGNDKQFQALCAVLEIQEMARDPNFKTNSLRVSNRVLLHKSLQEKLKGFSTDTIMRALNRARIPAGIIQDMQQVFEMDEAKELLFHAADRIGVKTYIGSNPKESPHFLPPPHVGEHTVEILAKSLQLSPQGIKRLIDTGAVR
ncbi:MAG: CoA transferase [Cyclobacteriaceae bacterium]|nr:CoA transferase [Cyclobacteriaceae bacterium]